MHPTSCPTAVADPGASAEPTAASASSPRAPPGAEAAPSRGPWIPIRSLAPSHRPRILKHVAALADRDRYLRFGCFVNDAQLGRYVAQLNFIRDELYGVFDGRLELVALAHVAFPACGPDHLSGSTAEFGVSVLPHLRGQGHGARLFEHAMLHARNRGVANFYIHALSENAAMLRIARNAGATVHRDGPESEAVLRLPPKTLASHVEQAVIEGAAVLDYGLKHQARLVGAVVDAIGEVREAVRNAERGAGQ